MADGVVGGDTIMRAPNRRVPTIREHLWDVAMRAVCRRFEHRWRDHGRKLPFGKREYCARCETNRVTLDADGSVHEASAVQVIAADPAFAEILYEARWGEPPRRKMKVGEWPAL